MSRHSKKIDDIDYPYNLVDAIFGEEIAWSADADHAAGLEKVLETLTDRERKVIRLRFEQGLNLEETGKEFNVTRERIRQVEAKAIRKMRHPSRSKLILHGVAGAAELSELRVKEKELEERDKLVAAQEGKIKEVLAFLKPMLDVFHVETEEPVEELSGPSELTKHTPIEDMYLSVRSYNCLKRYGVDTVEDLIDACEHPEELLKVRNLGRKSLQEVIEKLFYIAGVDYRGEFGF